ncbi:UNVERIFIED_ORG: hypothetical protein B2H98_11795 [Clostridium botulinum]|uniref:Uncharacterized protein n=1 Tax=Clostridium botulinum TaxID=1491 RepID=A0A6B4HZK6_CLOBO|nr:hypothetical protein [Clostridium botulinum]MBN1059817.1 hypothetical protein [Clostridium botulinum]MBN1062963.1 hypothetical protein [Clostridium botulinum]MBY6809912.1 hypothetical protein [Clostridium botulinum]MBY6823568.1 hypothetical protein [Clostridium botulinum]MBY6834179.1 hypothetical protein [Clostridium botulinum]
MKNKSSYLKKILNKICLGDKCLIIIMVILFLHVTFELFSGDNGVNSEETINAIDIIVRTTIASVFGYFISSNFVKSKKEISNEKESNNIYNELNDESNKCCLENKKCNEIDLLDKKNIIINNDNKKIEAEERRNNASKEQIIIVFIIGLVSLILLLLVRDFIEVSNAEIPIISQLRDIVCGCVGFLLGCPSNNR